MRKIKKPKGTVLGDIPPCTVNKIAGIISQPLAQINNSEKKNLRFRTNTVARRVARLSIF